MKKNIIKNYELAREYFSKYRIETDKVLDELKDIPLSVHCWQGDDCGGFEKKDSVLSGGGILSTGNHPGKARNIKELRDDIEKAFSMIPGKKRLNLHAMYGDFKSEYFDRDKIENKHFDSWIDWAQAINVGLDFNPTLFSHPKANDGFTLSSKNKNIRKFWVEHVKKSREISNYIGEKIGNPCIMNLWIPDGSKDLPVSRFEHRKFLIDSLDEIFSVKYEAKNVIDSLEGKLFGIGSESYVVGSYDFYLSYAIKNDKFITLDTGHFHPTELVSDKISALIPFVRGIVLHLSRGVRWDSDHVIILTQELISIMKEIVRAGALDKVYLASDFFDGSINRIGAWVIGIRAISKALLSALLEPVNILRDYENNNILFARLGFLEQLKTMPFGAIWDYYCIKMGVLTEDKWIEEVRNYENVLNKRTNF